MLNNPYQRAAVIFGSYVFFPFLYEVLMATVGEFPGSLGRYVLPASWAPQIRLSSGFTPFPHFKIASVYLYFNWGQALAVLIVYNLSQKKPEALFAAIGFCLLDLCVLSDVPPNTFRFFPVLLATSFFLFYILRGVILEAHFEVSSPLVRLVRHPKAFVGFLLLVVFVSVGGRIYFLKKAPERLLTVMTNGAAMVARSSGQSPGSKAGNLQALIDFKFKRYIEYVPRNHPLRPQIEMQFRQASEQIQHWRRLDRSQ